MAEVTDKIVMEGGAVARPGWRAWMPLVGITVVAAVLRFIRLGYQSYWVDEGYTVARVRGSFESLLEQLAKQGFPPGWYAALRGWCLTLEKVTGNGAWAFSPGATRMLPALLGTLTVPAMYWLARQFACRRMALLVALLAAVNPFLIYYSRDIKMYAALWLLCTLHMAFFFQWLNAGKSWGRKFWWGVVLWMVAGALMTATQSIGWLLVPLELLFLLTCRRRRWANLPVWLGGVAAMGAFPLFWFFYYVEPQKWFPRIAGRESAGSEWYRDYTDMSWRTIVSVPTSHLLGFLWPSYPPDRLIIRWFELGNDFNAHLETRSAHWLATAEWAAAILFGVILVAGLFPWRKRKKGAVPVMAETQLRWWWLIPWIVVPTAVLAATWIPAGSVWHRWVWQGLDVKPFWEPRYLGIILPAWLLWMAAAIRRLPGRWVRVGAAVLVVGVSVISAGSNYFAYRNAPYGRAAEIAERFVNPAERRSEAIAMPDGYWPSPAMNAALTVARGVRPGSEEDARYAAYREDNVPAGAVALWTVLPTNPAVVPQWVRSQGARANIQTIVLTDPFGDVTARESPLSTESLSALLGGSWRLVDEESYGLYFEWRFYVFNTWRTRVWQRVGG